MHIFTVKNDYGKIITNKGTVLCIQIYFFAQESEKNH